MRLKLAKANPAKTIPDITMMIFKETGMDNKIIPIIKGIDVKINP